MRAFAGVEVHVVVVFERILAAPCVEVFIFVGDCFYTTQHVQVVFLNCQVIVCSVGPCPSVALTEAAAHAVHVRLLNLAVERTIEELDVLDTDVALQRKTFDGINFQVGVTEDTPALVAVVATVIEFVNRVGNIACTESQRVGEIAVRVAHGDCRMLTHCSERDTAVVICAVTAIVPLCHHKVFANFHVIANVVSGVHTCRITTIERIVHQTVLVDKVTGEHHRAFRTAVGNCCCHVVGNAVAVHLVLPIGVGSANEAVGIEILNELRCVAVAVERMARLQTGILVG